MVMKEATVGRPAGEQAMTTVAINNSAALDIQNVLDVIVLAFSADPAARRMFPDPTQYLRYFPKFVKAFGGKPFRHGTAYHMYSFRSNLAGWDSGGVVSERRHWGIAARRRHDDE